MALNRTHVLQLLHQQDPKKRPNSQPSFADGLICGWNSRRDKISIELADDLHNAWKQGPSQRLNPAFNAKNGGVQYSLQMLPVLTPKARIFQH